MFQNVSTLTNTILSHNQCWVKIDKMWHNARLDKVDIIELDPMKYGIGVTKTEFTFIVSSKDFYEVVRFSNQDIWHEEYNTHTLSVHKARATGTDERINLTFFAPAKPAMLHRMTYEQGKKATFKVLRENNHLTNYQFDESVDYFDNEDQVLTIDIKFGEFLQLDFKRNTYHIFHINKPSDSVANFKIDDDYQYMRNIVDVSKVQENIGVLNANNSGHVYVLNGDVRLLGIHSKASDHCHMM